MLTQVSARDSVMRFYFIRKWKEIHWFLSDTFWYWICITYKALLLLQPIFLRKPSIVFSVYPPPHTHFLAYHWPANVLLLHPHSSANIRDVHLTTSGETFSSLLTWLLSNTMLHQSPDLQKCPYSLWHYYLLLFHSSDHSSVFFTLSFSSAH